MANVGVWGIPPPPTRLEELACEAGLPNNVVREWLRGEIERQRQTRTDAFIKAEADSD